MAVAGVVLGLIALIVAGTAMQQEKPVLNPIVGIFLGVVAVVGGLANVATGGAILAVGIIGLATGLVSLLVK